jgi:hypothetical protein
MVAIGRSTATGIVACELQSPMSSRAAVKIYRVGTAACELSRIRHVGSRHGATGRSTGRGTAACEPVAWRQFRAAVKSTAIGTAARELSRIRSGSCQWWLPILPRPDCGLHFSRLRHPGSCQWWLLEDL